MSDRRLLRFAEWARARIAECQRAENKFMRAMSEQDRRRGRSFYKSAGSTHVPQSAVEAWTERMTLQALSPPAVYQLRSPAA